MVCMIKPVYREEHEASKRMLVFCSITTIDSQVLSLELYNPKV